MPGIQKTRKNAGYSDTYVIFFYNIIIGLTCGARTPYQKYVSDIQNKNTRTGSNRNQN